MAIEWPRHLLRTKELLVEGLKVMGFARGKIGFRENRDGSYTVTLEIPVPGPPTDGDAPDEASSFRAMKRAASRG